MSAIVAALAIALTLSACGISGSQGDGPENPTPIAKSESDNIRIFSPSPEVAIVSPLIVKGEARVFESQFNYQLFDADGSVLAEGVGHAEASDMGQYGKFEITIGFKKPNGTEGTLKLFDYSAKDGSEIDVVKLAVKFGQ